MARILVADVREGSARMSRVLAGHDLVLVHTLDSAEKALRESEFDLIICGMLFDESRMFDFLRLAQSRAESRKIPFLCYRGMVDEKLSPLFKESIIISTKALGASAFIKIEKFKDDQSLKEELESWLPKEKRTT